MGESQVVISTCLLATKLSIPSGRSGFVVRRRLLDRLDAGINGRLTLITAPAGFGKTTLVASWLRAKHQRGKDCPGLGWLSIEAGDNDVTRFLSYFIAAWQTINPLIGQAAMSQLTMPSAPDALQVVTSLINDLALQKEMSVLVLDDFHHIDHPDLQAAIAYFMDHMPALCHLVIATREEPVISLPRLRARGEVIELRLPDLRFTSQEVAAFLGGTMRLTLSPETVNELEERTEGWVAALQFAALSIRSWTAGSSHERLSLDSVADGRQNIIDYLATEVLRQQSERVRRFLRQTAILDRLTASLCAAVTRQNNSREMLNYLEKRNLFVTRLAGDRVWLRYHHLFADFLRSELTADEQSVLHARASKWFEEHGAMPEAIKHALAARDYDQAIRLIRSHTDEAKRLGQFSALLGWINALPESIVAQCTDLLVEKAWISHSRGDIHTAEACLALATARQRRRDPAVHRAMLLGMRAYLGLYAGHPEDAYSLAHKALGLLKVEGTYYGAAALSLLGQAQRLMGDRRGATQTLRRAVQVAREAGNPLSGLQSLAHLAVLLAEQGSLHEAIILCEENSRLYLDARGQPLPVAAPVHLRLAVLYYEANNLGKAEDHLMMGLDLCQQLRTGYFVTIEGYLALAKLRNATGQIDAAWQALAKAKELAETVKNQGYLRAVIAASADLQLRHGFVSRAELTLRELQVKPTERSQQENLVFCRLMIRQRQIQPALDLLSEMEKTVQKDGRVGRLINIHLLQALAHLHSKASQAALDCLGKAICYATPGGYRRVFLDEDEDLRRLLPQVRPLAPQFIKDLLDHRLATSSVSQNGSQPLVEPLTKTQLLILQLVADGLSNRDIAKKMDITLGTTKWHLNQIFGKLHVSRRTQAISEGRRLKVL